MILSFSIFLDSSSKWLCMWWLNQNRPGYMISSFAEIKSSFYWDILKNMSAHHYLKTSTGICEDFFCSFSGSCMHAALNFRKMSNRNDYKALRNAIAYFTRNIFEWFIVNFSINSSIIFSFQRIWSSLPCPRKKKPGRGILCEPEISEDSIHI